MNTILGIVTIGSGSLVSILISVLVIALVFWLIWWVLGMMKLPHPLDLVARVILGIIAIVVLLRLIGVY